jgi:hypothetical protein
MSKAYFEGRNYGINGGPDSGRAVAVPVIMALALLLATLSSGCASLVRESWPMPRILDPVTEETPNVRS